MGLCFGSRHFPHHCQRKAKWFPSGTPSSASMFAEGPTLASSSCESASSSQQATCCQKEYVCCRLFKHIINRCVCTLLPHPPTYSSGSLTLSSLHLSLSFTSDSLPFSPSLFYPTHRIKEHTETHTRSS